MTCRFDLLRVKLDQFLAFLHMVAFFYQKLKSVAVHIYRIHADMDQEFQTVCKSKSACMACISHYHCYIRIRRCCYNRI